MSLRGPPGRKSKVFKNKKRDGYIWDGRGRKVTEREKGCKRAVYRFWKWISTTKKSGRG